MDWIIKAANHRNEERHRREAIDKAAPALWSNVRNAIGEAAKFYEKLEGNPLILEFNGSADHTVRVTLFEPRPASSNHEIGHETILFNQEDSTVDVFSAGLSTRRKFPISLNESGHACLTTEGRKVSIEEFTELALRDALFPTTG